ncbi:MAG: mannose-1-phosphate guanylyltransferase/mannose-6-phosphate isomerase [Methylococcales bacterium]
MKFIPVIMSGGAGSRLWPVSREQHPKPFIRLADGKSMLQHAWLRGVALPNVQEVITVTNRELFFKTEDEYQEINGESGSFISNSYILEPFGRNTAPAVVAAALRVAEEHGEDALLLVLAADHLIADQVAFFQAVSHASELATQGKLVTFGIHPEGPETGYGYIESEENSVLRFVEKPTLEKAKSYIESGRYLWNSGMFCFSAGVLIKEMEIYAPEILATTRECLEQSKKSYGEGFTQIQLNPELFAKVPDDSIDYAVMEKSNNVAVVPCNIGWSDIGSWSALGDLTEADEEGNRIDGEALLHQVTNCYIQSNKRVVGMVGVDNLIVIDTADALLVADRTSSQNVKYLYAQLKAQGHDAYKLHNTVKRPWGRYTVLECCEGFKIKRIEVKPGGILSLQIHQHRCEHWVVVSGEAKVTNCDKELIVKANESTYIQAGQKHRLENAGKTTLVMIEVQTGDYLGEDDIVRLEDKYGRVTDNTEIKENN